MLDSIDTAENFHLELAFESEDRAELLGQMVAAGIRYDAFHPVTHGGAPIAGGRRVVQIPGIAFPLEPAKCSDLAGTRWILDDLLLVCTGCGLDVS